MKHPPPFFLVTGISYSVSLFPPLLRIVSIVNIQERINKFPHASARISCFFGLLTFLLRFPFLFRYDLFFGSDHAISYLTVLRILRGKHEFYFPGTDYHGTVEPYFTALLFKIFGPSLPLGAAVGLMEWSIAVGLGVFLLIRATTPFHGMIAGFIAAVGVPFTLIYVTEPFIGYPASFMITLLLLWEAYALLERGPSVFRFLFFGFTIGIGLYIAKQCVPGILASLLSLFLFHTPAWNIRHSLRFISMGALGSGFIVGYLPEIWYRSHHPGYRSFSGLASPLVMARNFRESIIGSFAYFDAHPFSRVPEDIYFCHSIPFKLIRPAGFLDALFVILMLAVILFAMNRMRFSYKNGNFPLFLLTSLFFINLLIVILSRESLGNIFNTRRYLHTSAISFSLLTGYFLLFFWGQSRTWMRWLILAVGVLFLFRCGYHQYALLKLPDRCQELRWVIRGMDEEGINCGLAWFGPNYIIPAITNERIIFTNRNRDWVPIPEYDELVRQSKRMALASYRDEPVEREITFEGNIYLLDGKVHKNELLWWAPYRKLVK
jgi:hypothetical protein